MAQRKKKSQLGFTMMWSGTRERGAPTSWQGYFLFLRKGDLQVKMT